MLKKNIPVPTAVGLERDGKVLIKPYSPPYYKTMRDAVMAVVESKYSATGAFRDAHAATAWRDARAVQAGIPEYSQTAIEATVAYCEYVYGRHGRFPAACGPFRTCLAYQAHRLDEAFYDRFYRPEAAGVGA